MHPRLAEILALATSERDALERSALQLPYERWQARPAPEAWSVSEVFDHLQRVEVGVGRLVAKLVTEARAAGRLMPERSTASVLRTLDGRGIADRSSRRVAPERVSPRADARAPEVHESLRQSRATLLAVLADADGAALGELRWPHPLLGELDLYQWVLFVAQHEARHRAQVEEAIAQLQHR